MIDWFTGIVSYDASGLEPDLIYRVDRQGNILWETECWMELEGSFTDKMRLRRKPIDSQLRLWLPDDLADDLLKCDFLQLSGNPSKFLQGHNAFGASVAQIESMVDATMRALPAQIRPLELGCIGLPKIKSSRIDTAVMVDMGSHHDVHGWLNHVAGASRSRHGRALVSGDTVYWGKHSRRWSLKAYCKYCEMIEYGHADREINEMIREFVKNQLRIELTLRTPELKHNQGFDESVVWKYFDRLEVGVLEMARLTDIEGLPLSVQGVVMRWFNGYDPRMNMSRRSFYRHRRIILDVLGIDIAIPRHSQSSGVDRISFDTKFLKAHEVNQIPEPLQGFLFKPRSGLAFSAS